MPILFSTCFCFHDAITEIIHLSAGFLPVFILELCTYGTISHRLVPLMPPSHSFTLAFSHIEYASVNIGVVAQYFTSYSQLFISL